LIGYTQQAFTFLHYLADISMLLKVIKHLVAVAWRFTRSAALR
jgi:hypothetical protein